MISIRCEVVHSAMEDFFRECVQDGMEDIVLPIEYCPNQVEDVKCNMAPEKLENLYNRVMNGRHNQLHDCCTCLSLECATKLREAELLTVSHVLQVAILANERKYESSIRNAALGLLLNSVDIEGKLEEFLRDVQSE